MNTDPFSLSLFAAAIVAALYPLWWPLVRQLKLPASKIAAPSGDPLRAAADRVALVARDHADAISAMEKSRESETKRLTAECEAATEEVARLRAEIAAVAAIAVPTGQAVAP